MSGEKGEYDVRTWIDVENWIKNLASKITKPYDVVIGVKNGGIIPARLIARELCITDIQFISMFNKRAVDIPKLERNRRYLVIDDIIDTKQTLQSIRSSLNSYDYDFVACLSRYPVDNIAAEVLNHNKWVVFPWERTT